MEDDSLDDFFAKKDKTKKKNKSKLTPSDILAQQETGIKKGKKKKDKENESQSEDRKTTNDDEEWVDFEQELEKDYTGLRIQNLQIKTKEEEEGEEGEVNENDEEEDAETKEKREAASGPWRQQREHIPQPAVTAMPEPPPPEPEMPKEDKPKTKYVPPGARSGSSSSAAGTPSRLTARRKKNAPNLHSEDDFPTLGGGAPPEVKGWGSSESRGDFEKVHSGGRHAEDPGKVNQQLSLGNRFTSLQD